MQAEWCVDRHVCSCAGSSMLPPHAFAAELLAQLCYAVAVLKGVALDAVGCVLVGTPSTV